MYKSLYPGDLLEAVKKLDLDLLEELIARKNITSVLPQLNIEDLYITPEVFSQILIYKDLADFTLWNLNELILYITGPSHTPEATFENTTYEEVYREILNTSISPRGFLSAYFYPNLEYLKGLIECVTPNPSIRFAKCISENPLVIRFHTSIRPKLSISQSYLVNLEVQDYHKTLETNGYPLYGAYSLSLSALSSYCKILYSGVHMLNSAERFLFTNSRVSIEESYRRYSQEKIFHQCVVDIAHAFTSLLDTYLPISYTQDNLYRYNPKSMTRGDREQSIEVLSKSLQGSIYRKLRYHILISKGAISEEVTPEEITGQIIKEYNSVPYCNTVTKKDKTLHGSVDDLRDKFIFNHLSNTKGNLEQISFVEASNLKNAFRYVGQSNMVFVYRDTDLTIRNSEISCEHEGYNVDFTHKGTHAFNGRIRGDDAHTYTHLLVNSPLTRILDKVVGPGNYKILTDAGTLFSELGEEFFPESQGQGVGKTSELDYFNSISFSYCVPPLLPLREF